MKNISFSWVEFYSTFATELLHYSKDRETLIANLQSAYKEIGIKFPKLDRSDDITDIDPFTVFGLFNKGLTEANRLTILKGLAKNFSIMVPPPASFTGIPVLNNQNATFYPFTDDPSHGEHDIDTLWSLFEAALSYADTTTDANKEAFISIFNRAKNIKYNRWKLTMGLYWVRPMNYINLDSRNRWFIENQQKMPSECIAAINGLKVLPSGFDYIGICEIFADAFKTGKCVYHNFPELSHAAWVASEKVNQEKKTGKEVIESNEADPDVSEEFRDEEMFDEKVGGVRYWIYAAGENARLWEEFQAKGIMGIGWEKMGDLTQYHTKEEVKKKLREIYGSKSSFVNDGLTIWQFSHVVNKGDIVFVKKGLREVIGRGTVTSDYDYDDSRPEYKSIRSVQWEKEKYWHNDNQLPMKTLTEITKYTELCQTLEDYFTGGEMVPLHPLKEIPFYTSDEFLNEVFMDEDRYEKLVSTLRLKKNVIIEGPPGAGKTFCAKRLAWSMMNEKDPSRVTMIQFHQSYGYEDFIMGYRPVKEGFELKRGPFYEFCQKAEDDEDRDYFFIIDEINRGNMSRIFGELLMLIENDKRGHELRLLYANELFSVPKNLYIIGLMNTADRSLAMIDYALRRRFAFFHFSPAFETRLFKTYQTNINSPLLNSLLDHIVRLNNEIKDDPSLGDGFQIGHSYFSNLGGLSGEVLASRLDAIVEFELIPLLKEYWFDEQDKVRNWTSSLRGVLR